MSTSKDVREALRGLEGVEEGEFEEKLIRLLTPASKEEKRERVIRMVADGIMTRTALIALVQWLGEREITLPIELHAQILVALGGEEVA